MGIMHEDLAETLIIQAFEAVDPDGTISFAFQGGEPTIAGLPFFEHFVDKVHELQPPSVNVVCLLQSWQTAILFASAITIIWYQLDADFSRRS